MKVHEIMTAHARCVGPDNTLVEAAGLMRELDVGALPVCDEDRVEGIVTDRDLALRAVAKGLDPNTTPVRDVMSTGVMFTFADQEVEEAVRTMEDCQIRRLPVLNRQKRLVGMFSLGDVAISSNPAFSGTALRDVSQPTVPSNRQQRLRRSAFDSVPQRKADRNGASAEVQPRARSRGKGVTRSSRSGRTRVKSGGRSARSTSGRKRSAAARRSPARARS